MSLLHRLATAAFFAPSAKPLLNRLGLAMVVAAATAIPAHAGIAWTVNVYSLMQDIQTSVYEDEESQSNFRLNGLSSGNGFIVRTGDTIKATLRLDAPWSVPATSNVSWLSLYLYSTLPPPPVQNNSQCNSVVSLYLNGSLVTQASGGAGTSNQIAAGGLWFPPDNTAFSFDEAVFDIDSITLDRGLVVDTAGVQFLLRAPVPEPSAYAMALAGLGCGGYSMWRWRKRA